MTELRQDPTTRNWVIVAPARKVRPHDRVAPAGEEGRSRASCPFCPGRESQTPRELWRLAGPDGSWRVRVVPNKFPALTPDAGRGREERDGFLAMPGHGHHEVIVESPHHDWDLATATEPEVRAVLEAYRARYQALREAGDSALIVIFRNHGPGSGTSLEHPHSQVLATPVVPLQVRRRLDVARQHFDDFGTCLYAEVVDRELGDGRRVLTAAQRIAAFQPFAAAVLFETWIMPRFHQPSFGQATDGLLDELASVLRSVLYGLRVALEDPPYNLVIHSAPPGDEGRQYFVWHLQIVPRLATPAGFELGTGIPINPSRPEDTAATLRASIESRGGE